MKKFLNTILISGLLLGALSVAPSQALADCQAIYGGGQVCTTNFSFTIEKMVQRPGKGGGDFVDNLSINDARYSPSDTVNFKILVKNTGTQTIPTITVVDTFPQFINFVSGPGTYDSNTKTLTFAVNNLGAGQSQTYDVSGKVSDSSLLPSDQGVICLINNAKGTDNNGITDSRNSQFCVQKTVTSTTPQVIGTSTVTSTPATGPEMLPLLALIPGGLGGLILRKKSLNK